MTDEVFALVPTYGVWLIFAATFLSCLAVPMPSSMIMLAGGAFVASGDLDLIPVVTSAWIGAVAGDQTGYWATRGAGRAMVDRLAARPKRGDIIRKARDLLDRRGGIAVFLSRWLLSPLGPYVNFAAGAGGLDWRVFVLWGMAGEAIWVTAYVGLGYAFTGSLGAVASLLGNLSGLLAALAVAGLAGAYLLNAVRTHAEPHR
jgi:membrane protein DedA with SNARE-associated domain